MEKPIRSKYGSLKISSSEIEIRIENIFFVLKLRWLLVGYIIGFYTNYLMLGTYEPSMEFLKYWIIIGTVFSLVLLLISYFVFK